MIIGVVKEARTGETRVAATPATVAQLLKLGYDVVVEPGAGAASSFPDAAYVEAGATIGDPLRGRRRVRCQCAVDATSWTACGPGRRWSRSSRRRWIPALVEDLARPADHGAGDGCGAADLAGAVAGRAVLDGQHRGLPRGGRGGPCLRPVLHRSSDRGGQGPAGESAGRGCGRGRAGGHRRGGQSGRDRAGHRPATRGGRPGPVPGRGVPGGRGSPTSRCRPPATPRRCPTTTTPEQRRSTPLDCRRQTSSSPRR